jgi:hypothetical protein
MPEKKLWHPPSYDRADAQAIQHLAAYAAGQETQPPTPQTVKIALDWIINHAAATYDNGFLPDDPGGRIAAFMDGRQFVGQQIVKLMKINVGKVFQKRGNNGEVDVG